VGFVKEIGFKPSSESKEKEVMGEGIGE